MENSPAISVIIPTYNRADWICEAVDSVFAQTFTDYELLVVDDGSKDNTKEVLSRYGDKLSYIYQINAGCSAARNTGVQASKGRWIAFLDSDDIWEKDKLEMQWNDLQRYPDAVAHSTNARIFRDHIGKEVDLFDYIGFSEDLNEKVSFIERPLMQQMKYGFGWPQSILTRRDILLSTPLFDTNLKLWQDMDLFYLIASKGGWVVNNTVMVHILRRNEDAELNLSIQSEKDRVLSYSERVVLLNRLLAEKNLSDVEQREAEGKLSNSYITLGIEQIMKDDRKAGRANLNKGCSIDSSFKNQVKRMISFMPGFVTKKTFQLWRA